MLAEEEQQDASGEDESQSHLQFTDGQEVKCMGLVTDISKKIAKSGREMAFLKVEDLYGTLEIVCFPNIFQKMKAFLKTEKIYSIDCKISISGENRVSLFAESFSEISTASS